MAEYDKLVRDRIPEIIEKDGRKCVTEKASGDVLFEYLDRKIDEELSEFRESRSPEEIADLLEVLFAVASELGCSEEELMSIREKKREERGGFEEGFVLKKTYQ